jgi:hypothetical protein
MKNLRKQYLIILLSAFVPFNIAFAQLSYVMTPSNTGYTPLSGATGIPDLSAGSDLTVTPPIPIGFNFVFDGTTYTDVQVSDNGYVHMGNDLGSTGYGNAGGDEVVPNDFTDSSGFVPGVNTMRPFLAPLWEELAVANIGGNASYLTSGISPNQTFTIEWDKMSWRAPTGTDQVSFQVVLHETTNIIEFIYRADPVALGPLPTASIGLAGITAGDYYSLSDDGPNPVVSKTVNTTSIGVKPATGQRYTWAPAPVAGIAAVKENVYLKAYYDQNAEKLNISGDFKETGNYTAEIRDISGKLLCKDNFRVETAGGNNFKIALPNCTNGIYMISVSGKNVLMQSKFIKE